MRIRPYRTLENVIDGAVITFVDITDLKQARESEQKLLAFSESVVDAVRGPLVVLDGNLEVVSANRSFYRVFQIEPETTVGRRLYDLAGGEWDIPDLRRLLEQLLAQNRAFDDFRLTHDFEGIGPRTLLLNARRIPPPPGQADLILLAMEDITDSPKERDRKDMEREPNGPKEARHEQPE
ncbi:MAG: PAS domain-containing protein [Deltaproteobacteria bacterium]|nr:PAS domain-containing protein [Deltaproteobacteria bacterium]